jgi:protein-S-isoprenylcysteine O-methyltransferase Ste14
MSDRALASDSSAQARPSFFARQLHDLLRRRWRQRQFVGIAFVVLLCWLGGAPAVAPYVAGCVLVVAGELFRLWASGHVKKDKQLANDGPYSMVRHPLYTGNLTLLAGFCLACGLWWSWPAACLLVLLFYPPTIAKEDRKLHGLFGEQWETWAARTPALLPTRLPSRSAGRWSLRQSLMENGEPLYALGFAVGLYFLGKGL